MVVSNPTPIIVVLWLWWRRHHVGDGRALTGKLTLMLLMMLRGKSHDSPRNRSTFNINNINNININFLLMLDHHHGQPNTTMTMQWGRAHDGGVGQDSRRAARDGTGFEKSNERVHMGSRHILSSQVCFFFLCFFILLIFYSFIICQASTVPQHRNTSHQGLET